MVVSHLCNLHAFDTVVLDFVQTLPNEKNLDLLMFSAWQKREARENEF